MSTYRDKAVMFDGEGVRCISSGTIGHIILLDNVHGFYFIHNDGDRDYCWDIGRSSDPKIQNVTYSHGWFHAIEDIDNFELLKD